MAANTQYVTLTPNVPAQVTISPAVPTVSVMNRNGVAELFFTVDGSTPAAGAAGTYVLPAAAGEAERVNTAPVQTGQTTAVYVTLLSTAAVTVFVDGSQSPETLTPGTGSNPGGTGTLASPGYTRIEDGASNAVATVAQFHNGDNQNPGSTANGLLTGGVAQLLNASQNLDRQRETGPDVATNIGVATGTQQLAWPVTVGPVTTGAVTGSATAQTITVTNVAGTTRGIAWALTIGQTLILEPNTATQEAFVITALNTSTKAVTGVIRNNHAAAAPVSAFYYDQARSGVIPDGSPGQGMAAGATYLLNTTLNGGNGGWEGERSAAGELDGANGTGTAVAAEYEYNGGGPGGGYYDRARNLQGKGVGSNTLSAATLAAATTFTLAAGPVPVAGQPVYIQGAGAEVAYVSTVAGQTVTLVSGLTAAHASGATVQWDVYAGPVGPGINGFLPTGVGIEEEALYDPVSGLYYVERAATQDNVAPQNVVMENEALWNGSGFDRARTNLAVTLVSGQVITTAAYTSPTQLNVNGHALHVILNVTAVTGTTPSVAFTVNGISASGVAYPLLTSAAITATGVTVLRIGPALTPAANTVANDWVPRSFQIVSTVPTGTTPSFTVTVDYNLSE